MAFGPNARPARTKLPWDVWKIIWEILLATLATTSLNTDPQPARRDASDLARYCLVSHDWCGYFQRRLWRHILLGDNRDHKTHERAQGFATTVQARPDLAGAVVVLQLYADPTYLDHSSADVLRVLTLVLCALPALEELTLIGPMLGYFLSMPEGSVPLGLRSAHLAGPPSKFHLTLRNLARLTTLRLAHSAFTTTAFLGCVHDQLENLTTLSIECIASPLDHPALIQLFSGDFGRRLGHLALLLSPNCRTRSYPRQLLSLAPNVRSLALSTRAANISELPLLPHLETLCLCDVDQTDLLRHLSTLLRQLVECVAHTPSRLPSLRWVRLGRCPPELSTDGAVTARVRDWLGQLGRQGIKVQFEGANAFDGYGGTTDEVSHGLGTTLPTSAYLPKLSSNRV